MTSGRFCKLISRQYPPHVVAHAYNRVSWRDSSYPWGWQPISRDGIFYPTDAKEKFLNGDVPFEGTIAIGTVSYEAGLTEQLFGPVLFARLDSSEFGEP